MTKYISTSLFILFFVSTTLFAQQDVTKPIMTKKYNAITNLITWPDEFNPKKSKFYVHNEIDIKARPEIVWQLLINATDWHTYYKGAQSPIEILDSATKVLKNNVTFTFHTMGLHLKPVIKEFVPNQKLAWEVRAKNITGYHAWVIVPTAEGCRLITAESQNGFLTFLQKIFQPKKLLKLHDTWLKVIKANAEGTNKISMFERQELNEQLLFSLNKFNTAIANLNNEQLHYKASEKKWSIAECIEHVTLAELRFPEIVKEEINKAPNPIFRNKIKLKDNEIRSRMISKEWKATSPEIFKPTGRFSNVEEALKIFTTQRQQTIDYVRNTNDDLRNHFWKHPLTGYIDL